MDLQPYDLAPRQIPGLALALGADCDGGSDAPLPKNFMIATEIRAGAANWCNTMKTDLINLGLGQIDQTFNNAVTKTANQLHGKKGVAMSLLFALTPQGRAVIKAATAADAILVNGCAQAVTALATKGAQGCTKDLNWYDAKHAKGQTSTGVRSGGIDVSYGADEFGYMSIEFMKP